eukprot:6186144-Pleurochrysis_carterae.AAC.1
MLSDVSILAALLVNCQERHDMLQKRTADRRPFTVITLLTAYFTPSSAPQLRKQSQRNKRRTRACRYLPEESVDPARQQRARLHVSHPRERLQLVAVEREGNARRLHALAVTLVPARKQGTTPLPPSRLARPSATRRKRRLASKVKFDVEKVSTGRAGERWKAVGKFKYGSECVQARRNGSAKSAR